MGHSIGLVRTTTQIHDMTPWHTSSNADHSLYTLYTIQPLKVITNVYTINLYIFTLANNTFIAAIIWTLTKSWWKNWKTFVDFSWILNKTCLVQNPKPGPKNRKGISWWNRRSTLERRRSWSPKDEERVGRNLQERKSTHQKEFRRRRIGISYDAIQYPA